jgi:hypothetical protein
MSKKYLDEEGLAVLWAAIKARDLNIVNSATVYGAVRDGAGKEISAEYIHNSAKGVSNGVATLGADGKIPSSQLPSYVDDVLEYGNKSNFPGVGESGKIYVSTVDNKTYRWSGTQYTEISASLAIGTVAGTAFDGGVGTTLQQNFANFRDGVTSGATKVGLALKADSADKATYDKNGKDFTTYYLPVDTYNGFKKELCTDGTQIVKKAEKAQSADNAGYASRAYEATSATQAVRDGNNNIIADTYVKNVVQKGSGADTSRALVTNAGDSIKFQVLEYGNSDTPAERATISLGYDAIVLRAYNDIKIGDSYTESVILGGSDGVFVKHGTTNNEVLDTSMALTNTEIDNILV